MTRTRKQKPFMCGSCHQRCHTRDGLENHILQKHKHQRAVPFFTLSGVISVEPIEDALSEMAEATE